MARFSDLDRMLTAALQGGASMQSIAAGDNPIGNYAKWKIWQSEADHKVGPRPVAGAMTEVIVHPFSVDYGTGASAFYIRTKAQQAALGFGGVTAELCSHAGLASQGVRIPQSSNVKAARAVVRNKVKEAEKPSRITKLRYTPSSTASKSVPFGRSSATDSYSEACRRIAVAVKAAGAFSVSFREEKWDEQITVVTGG